MDDGGSRTVTNLRRPNSRRMLVALLAVGLLAAPIEAQDDRAAGRDIVKKWQSAIVNVRVVLKMRVSVGGREMQSMDESVETVGTVIHPNGLTVLSLGALNPGAMMNKIIGATSQGSGDRPQLNSEPTDVKIRFPDGREVSARIVLRDEDLDLAFLMPIAKLDKPLVAIDLTNATKPSLLDEVIVLSRLGRVGGWAPAAALHNIGAIIEKPRTFFVTDAPGGGTSMGTPAFLPNGKVVGLMTLRSVDPGRPGMLAMMGSSEGLGLLPVILPAEDVVEIAKQATSK